MSPRAEGRGRLTAGDRVRRLLALIPWVAAHPDGVPVDEVCRRFSIERRTLLADLDAMLMVGVDAIGPESFVDVAVDEGRVYVSMAQWFDRPLRLTPEQALALVAAGQGLLGSEERAGTASEDGPLARGLAKLAEVLGVEPGEDIHVQLPPAAADTLRTVQDAARSGLRLAIDYYVFGRDEVTHREIDPTHVFADQGAWYVLAWCHTASAERVFRVDRIRSAAPTGATFPPAGAGERPRVFAPDAGAPRVTLDLAHAARWVAAQYPAEDVAEQPDGCLRVTLAVAGRPWLERLLLRLGPDARVVAADATLAEAGPDAARRVLSRYGVDAPPASPRP